MRVRLHRLLLLATIPLLAFAWMQSAASATSAELVLNGGFESGQVPWQISGATIVTTRVHSGTHSLDVCNYNRCDDEGWQTVSVPASFTQASFTYWSFVATREAPGSPCADSLALQLRTSTGATISKVGTLCNGDASSSWVQRSADVTAALAPYAGKQVQLYFHGLGNRTLSTDFVLDDASLVTATSTTTSASSATTVTTTPTSTTSTTAPAAGRWTPAVGASWQLQLQGNVDTSVGASVFDVDGFDSSASVVQTLHAQGKHAICYIDAGTWENWRPDAAQFPSSVLGQGNGWPGEKWLDVRAVAILQPLMQNRVAQQCKSKGFDAVDWDNLDGFANSTGFPLTYQDQLAYNRMLAGVAHSAGLSVGLKNDLDQIGDLVGSFDFAVNEQCNQYNECGTLLPFINAGKPVFQVEYQLTPPNFCPADIAARFSGIQKQLGLDAAVTPCQPY